MELADIKTGDTVVVHAADCPRDNDGKRRDLIGVVLAHPGDDPSHSRTISVLVHFDGVQDAWLGERQFPTTHPLYSRTAGKRCWWVNHNAVKEKVSTAATKASGGNCTVCNHFNEYQSGPYTCWVHTH